MVYRNYDDVLAENVTERYVRKSSAYSLSSHQSYVRWVIGLVGHWSHGSLMGHIGHGHIGYGSHVLWVTLVVGRIGHGSFWSWVTWVMGHIGHGSHVMGHVCHESHGSWVTWIMGHIGHGSQANDPISAVRWVWRWRFYRNDIKLWSGLGLGSLLRLVGLGIMVSKFFYV